MWPDALNLWKGQIRSETFNLTKETISVKNVDLQKT